MTASSIRSAWEKLSAITCWALTESGLVVMLPSEVNADPSSVPMATTEAARISPQAARIRHGWTAETRARRWVIDVLLACASRSSRSFERVAGHLVVPLVGPVGSMCRALGGDPGREDVVGVVGQVVADQGVEQVGVVVEVSGGNRDQLSVPGRGGVLRCPGEETRACSAGCSVTSAAATSSAAESFVLAQSRISPGAVASPPISRRSKTSKSGGMRSLWRWALTIP